MANELSYVPKQIKAARRLLAAAPDLIDNAPGIKEIENISRWAMAVKTYWGEVDDLRRSAEWVVLLASGKIGLELLRFPPSKGTRGQLIGPGIVGSKCENPPRLADLVGSKTRALNLKKMVRLLTCDGNWDRVGKTQLMGVCESLWAGGHDATIAGVIRFVLDERGLARRKASRAAVPLIDGMDLRIGDCREVLADVADRSVAAVITDPPYEAEAEPLYRWLAEWSARVLVPGGSLICYTGHWSLNRDMAIFDRHLRYWWIMAMLHGQSRRLPGKFIIAGFKPVLWYVKGFRRGRSLVPDLLKPPTRDKDKHGWGQGEGGVTALIEHLSEPGELIADPFAGTAQWGNIAASMGRRWVGADIVRGGDERVEAAE